MKKIFTHNYLSLPESLIIGQSKKLTMDTPIIDYINSGYDKKKGFTLIELSVVLAIVALLMGFSLSTLTAFQGGKKVEITKTKLEAIQKAMELYVKQNGYLPCVAARDILIGDPLFGLSEDCTGAPSPGAIKIFTGLGDVWIGSVPVRDLLLPKNMYYDGWGKSFTYAISGYHTATATYNNAGEVSVVDGNMISVIVDTAHLPQDLSYVLLSHGQDGKGAFNYLTGAQKSCAPPATTQDAENCNDDIVFVDTSFNDGTVVANFFDDIILWKAKAVIPDELGLTTVIAVHSQTTTVPTCPIDWNKLWEGYSFSAASGGNGSSSSIDLGESGSCLSEFRPMSFIECDGNGSGQCDYYTPLDWSYWLATETVDSLPVGGIPLSLPKVSRCSVCEKKAPIIVRHSQTTLDPSCPVGWMELWSGYSFLMVNGGDNSNTGTDLSSPGSCLQEFRPMAFIECTGFGSGECDYYTAFDSSYWLATETVDSGLVGGIGPNLPRIGRCKVCSR